MNKTTLILICLLLCCVQEVKTQPRNANTKQKQQATTNSPSPVATKTPVNNAAENAGEAYRKERDAKDDVFREEQARQGRVVSDATVNLVWVTAVYVGITAVYAFFAGLTLWQIKKQAASAKEQVEKMRDTLDVIRDQSKTLRRQAIGTTSQARSTRDALIETRSMVKQNEEIVKAMQGQLDAINKQEAHLSDQASAAKEQAGIMQGQLSAIETQSELAEKSIAHAEQSSIYANRAYVLAKIRNPEPYQFKLAIENSGNTPANNVRVSYSCRVMERDPWRIDEQTGRVVYDAGFDVTVRLGVIAPNGSHETIWTVAFTPRTEIERQEWRNGVKLFCWGRISYEDIFNKDRHTDFCFYKSERQPEGYHSEYGNEAW